MSSDKNIYLGIYFLTYFISRKIKVSEILFKKNKIFHNMSLDKKKIQMKTLKWLTWWWTWNLKISGFTWIQNKEHLVLRLAISPSVGQVSLICLVSPFYPLVGWLLTLSWFYWFYFVDFLMDHSLLAASQLQFTQTSSMPILLLIPQMANWDFYKVSYQLLAQPASWFSEVNGLDRQTDGQTEEWLYLSWIKLTLL